MTLHADEFIRRFLLHVLPARYVRIRHFGLLANRNRKDNIASCREFLGTGKTVTKEKARQGILAGTATQNLRDRCHYLSRMPERKDVQDSAAAPLSVQQSTRVMQMSILHNRNTLSPASREKNVLLRHVLLLPKIVHSDLFRSSVDQSIPLSMLVTDRYRYKSGNTAPLLTCLSMEKTKKR